MTSGTRGRAGRGLQSRAMRQDKLMSAAGLVVWLGCAVPTLLVMRNGQLTGWHALTWWSAFFCFGVAWLWLQRGTGLGIRWRFVLLILEFLAAVTMVSLGVSGT